MRKVLLYGPKLNVVSKRSYGGGTGGYTRNMTVYLKYFNLSDFTILPCFHTIKGEMNLGVFTNPIRLIIDLFVFLHKLVKHKISITHILGQYRGAIIREVSIVLLSKLFGIKVLYEIKAGAFIKSYESGNVFYKKLTDIIIKNTNLVLVEGKIYNKYILESYNQKAYYFPNVVPSDEIPLEVHEKFSSNTLKVIFVGFAYEGKGIKELLNGANIFANDGNLIELTLVGQVGLEIKNYIRKCSLSKNLKLILKGKLKHEDVLIEFTKNDVYCYPTRHDGEGHNNTINEALMHGLVISSTKLGFIGDFLNEENSYPINKLKEEEIAKIFLDIIEDVPLAIKKSMKGRNLILAEFNSQKAKSKLGIYYNEILKS